MAWLGIVALLLAVSLLPVLLVVRRVVAQARLHHRRYEQRAAARPAFHLDASVPALRARSEPSTLRESDRRPEVFRPVTPVPVPAAPNDAPPADAPATDFDYTIKRHPAAQPRQVSDQGGFAEAPILLHGRQGACFLIHRTIFLN